MHARAPHRIAVGVAATAALALGLLAPTAASAAPPPPASLVAPADGSTTSTVVPTLHVEATDADGGPLTVRLEGRERGTTVPAPTAGEPFSVVIVPDTQNYTFANTDLLHTQLEWVRDSRDALDTAFVIQVGDLVSDWAVPRHWSNASGAFRILDDAGVPNTVVPGNHDFPNATGDLSVYNSHFPPSRYADASWNDASTRYGGHLGQSQFGPDPIDRGNGDSYALFSAGGRDFLVLNLEWEAPAYALDWADRVLDAHPDRTVIMATHSFLNVAGQRMATAQRPGGTATAALWEDFVRRHCQIRLVVSGHAHDGDAGESRRTDPNACGQPVQQVLTDYQGRANGGDGWLRYYTFDPAAGTMRATTYSPVLDRFETDADSAFTVPFELAPREPAPFAPIATRELAAPGAATAEWPGLEHDTEYEWRAVVDDGTDTSVSPVWTLRTPPEPEQVLAADAFSRTVTGGWGTADAGGAWTVPTGAAALSVGGGRGVMSLAPGGTREARLAGVPVTDAVIDVRLAADVAARGGAASATVIGRLVGTANYALRARFEPNGVLRVYLLRGETALRSAVATWSPGQSFSARLAVTGTNPTRLDASLWPTLAAEPSSWQLTATDGTAGLQQPGVVTLRSSVSSSSSVPLTRVSYDDLRVVAPGGPVPNAPPVARMTSSVEALTARVDGRASSDPDGTVASFAWSFGDGGTATGATAEHAYAAAGTYPVTLTVTDDDGATATTSASVTVAAAPNAPPTAAIAAPVISGRTVSVDGRGSSDADGSIVQHRWDFGDGSSATGPTASHTYPSDGTRTITLTVTDDDGASASATRSVTVAAAPGPTVLGADAFGRTVANGWGAADTGGAWTLTGSASSFSVGSGAGTMTLARGATRDARLGAVRMTDASVLVRVSADVPSAGGAASATVIGRLVGADSYAARVRFEPGGVARVYLLRNETSLGTFLVQGGWSAGEAFLVRLEVRGTAPTALALKVWRASAAEPASWQLRATDATAAMQTAGVPALRASVSSTSTVATTRLRFDDYLVERAP